MKVKKWERKVKMCVKYEKYERIHTEIHARYTNNVIGTEQLKKKIGLKCAKIQ